MKKPARGGVWDGQVFGTFEQKVDSIRCAPHACTARWLKRIELDQPFKPHRSLDRWSRYPHHLHRNILEFCATDISDGLHSIDAGLAPIDLMITGVKGAPLVICLDGNSPRGDNRNPPFFSGFGVMPTDIPVSHVAVSDTTLSLDANITLSWYAGSDGIRLQEMLPTIFRHIIATLQPSSVWFFGGSGGGFASLYYANTIPNSTALIWNPQTDILGYNRDSVLQYAKVGFGIDADPDAFDQLAKRVEVRLPFNDINQSCKIIYMQNRTDWHVARQLGPLLDRMGLPRQAGPFSGLVARNFYLYIGEWGAGHAVPPKPALSAILKANLSTDQDLFSEHGKRIHGIMKAAFNDDQPLATLRPESDQDRLARLLRCLEAVDTANVDEMRTILTHLLEDRISEYRHRLGD